MQTLLKVNTPCIGICSTVYGDDICRGCKRSAQEVIDWNTYTEAQQQTIFLRLASLQVDIMRDILTVWDATALRRGLDLQQIRYRSETDPLCWAYHLLRVSATKITDIMSYGLAINSAYRHYSLPALFKLIDDELLRAAIV